MKMTEEDFAIVKAEFTGICEGFKKLIPIHDKYGDDLKTVMTEEQTKEIDALMTEVESLIR